MAKCERWRRENVNKELKIFEVHLKVKINVLLILITIHNNHNKQ